MALTRIDNPTPSAPEALADYVQILAVANAAQLQALRGNSHSCIDFANNFAREGVVFYVAGVLYKAVTDQAIGGTPSKYVKITPSEATAAIDYVASLAGVSWNDAQSGYYDGSGNLYVFDEARAVYDGVVSAGKTLAGQIAYIAGALFVKAGITMAGALGGATTGNFSGIITASGGITENSVTMRRKIINIGDWNMDTTITKNVAHGLTLANIRSAQAFIRSDDASATNPLDKYDNPSGLVSGSVNIQSTNVVLARTTGGLFDDTTYDSTSYNRGWVVILYEA